MDCVYERIGGSGVEINYQCGNCGKRFVTSPIPGVPDGMYYSGNRAVGDVFYCEDCVKTWKERNGKEFDEQYKNPQRLFVKWWNNLVDRNLKDKRKIKAYRRTIVGGHVECVVVEEAE